MPARRSPSVPPAPVPKSAIGMFTGNQLPVDVPTALDRERLAEMKGPPGIRLSDTSNRPGRYRGTNLVPELFRGQRHVNRPVDLEIASIEADPGPFVSRNPDAAS